MALTLPLPCFGFRRCCTLLTVHISMLGWILPGVVGQRAVAWDAGISQPLEWGALPTAWGECEAKAGGRGSMWFMAIN